LIDIEEIKNQELQKIVFLFQELSKIPRESGNEKQISNYIADFAKNLNLFFMQDAFNNLVVYLPANNGSDDVIAIQSHLDMVCDKIETSLHNFKTDPIQLFLDGDFIKSKETNIGADNGIGVAMMLALMQDQRIQHCNVELIFTTSEESNMNGVKNFDARNLHTNKIISLDAFRDNVITFGCASNYSRVMGVIEAQHNIQVPQEIFTYTLRLEGFKGGHSGAEISERRGNPIYIGMNLLCGISNKNDLILNNVDSGEWVTKIPTNAKFVFSTFHPLDQASFKDILTDFEKNCREKFRNENIKITLKELNGNNFGFDKNTTQKILKYFTRIPNGVINTANQSDIATLSTNLGTCWVKDGKLYFETSIRSNLNEEQTEVFLNLLKRQEQKYNIQTLQLYNLPGYVQDENCELIKFIAQKYKKLFNEEPILKQEHFTLECAWFNQKIKDLEYVSISPNIYNAHNQKEMVSLTSIMKTWTLLKNITPGIKNQVEHEFEESNSSIQTFH